jgi:hypothetical protein
LWSQAKEDDGIVKKKTGPRQHRKPSALVSLTFAEAEGLSQRAAFHAWKACVINTQLPPPNNGIGGID